MKVEILEDIAGRLIFRSNALRGDDRSNPFIHAQNCLIYSMNWNTL